MYDLPPSSPAADYGMIERMCRLAAYIGPEISLARFLLRPQHGLMQQSWEPREMRGARLNADGFGFGWFDRTQRPARYLNAMPIWADANLPALGGSLHARLWMANVRSATAPSASHVVNTQPFADDEMLFLHNGYITDFATTLRPYLRQILPPHIEAGVQGNTDSEYLFALLRHILAEDDDMALEEGLLQMFRRVEDSLDGPSALLNIVVTDGERLYATRHALRDDCPSLYFTVDDEDYPSGLLVASEPLTDSAFWRAVPAHHLLVLDPQAPPELIPL